MTKLDYNTKSRDVRWVLLCTTAENQNKNVQGPNHILLFNVKIPKRGLRGLSKKKNIYISGLSVLTVMCQLLIQWSYYFSLWNGAQDTQSSIKKIFQGFHDKKVCSATLNTYTHTVNLFCMQRHTLWGLMFIHQIPQRVLCVFYSKPQNNGWPICAQTHKCTSADTG